MKFVEIGDNLVNIDDVAAFRVTETWTTPHKFYLEFVSKVASGNSNDAAPLASMEFNTKGEAVAALKKVREYLENDKLFDRKII